MPTVENNEVPVIKPELARIATESTHYPGATFSSPIGHFDEARQAQIDSEKEAFRAFRKDVETSRALIEAMNTLDEQIVVRYGNLVSIKNALVQALQQVDFLLESSSRLKPVLSDDDITKQRQVDELKAVLANRNT